LFILHQQSTSRPTGKLKAFGSNMLSLKATVSAVPTKSRAGQPRILDLPTEIFYDILGYVQHANAGYLDDILSFSLTCRRLRQAALPVLFRNVHVVLHDDCSTDRHHALLRNDHLLEHVRNLHVYEQRFRYSLPLNGDIPELEILPGHGGEHQDCPAQSLLIQKMPHLRNLRIIKY